MLEIRNRAPPSTLPPHLTVSFTHAFQMLLTANGTLCVLLEASHFDLVNTLFTVPALEVLFQLIRRIAL
jgi:hypothetical protein